MDFKQELINYARKEIDPIKHPSRGKSEIEIKNIELLTNILVSFLKYEVTDPSLARIESNFKSAFKNINDLNKSTLASALEQLATNFESFIKKIAYLKFYNDFPDLWTGTSVYKGINKSTLGDLLMSVVSVKDSENERKSLQYPSLLVDFKGIRQAVYDKARQIRNSVHEAREYSTIELIASINLLLGVYFLAIEDNKVFLASKLLPEYLLLSKKLENEEYSTLDKLYIEQLGIKNKELELTASKVSFYTDILPEFDQEDELEGTGSEDGKEVNIEVESVVDIAVNSDGFILVGSPGSGKTTALKKIFIYFAKDFLSQLLKNKYPILIDANFFNFDCGFLKLIQNEIESSSFEELKAKYELVVLIDGINEINETFKPSALSELKYLLKNNPDITFIISSRKYGYKSNFDLPIYELMVPTETQIKPFISNVLGTEKAKQLWAELINNKSIYPFVFNPLYLKMIIKVFQLKGQKLPKNKGLLYNIFCDIILERESKFYSTNKETKKDILSDLAFWMRRNGIHKRINKSLALREICSKLSLLHANIDVNDLINELVDNNFIILENDYLEFLHESYEEYFVGIEIKNRFLKNSLPAGDFINENWFDAVLIASDLFIDNADRLSFFEYLYSGEKRSIRKHLNELDTSDINENLQIACKIAFDLRDSYPPIYEKAIKYLNNYLSVWVINNFKNKFSISFNKLIECVAILSDIGLFNRLFNSIEFINYWLFNQQYDSQHELQEEKDKTPKKFDETFLERFSIFSDNLSDFSAFYYFINRIVIENKYWFSKSIARSLNYFKRNITQTQDYHQLVKAYYIHNSKSLLRIIGQKDLDFFINNYPEKNKKYYAFITTQIATSSLARFILFSTLKKGKQEFEIIELSFEKLLKFPDTFKHALVIFNSIDTEIKARLLSIINIRKCLYGIPISYFTELNIDLACGSQQIYPVQEEKKMKSLDLFNLEIQSIKNKTGFNLLKHPDSQLKDMDWKAKFSGSNLSHKERNIMRKLGLNFLIDDLVNSNEVGYIVDVNIYDDYCMYHMMALKSKRLYSLKIPNQSNLSIFEKGSFFYKQSSMMIRPVNDNFIFNNYCIKSIIIRANTDLKEGFIKNNQRDIFGNKDFFFLYKDCTFNPINGTSVKFIPGFNFSRKYYKMPFAYQIKRDINEF